MTYTLILTLSAMGTSHTTRHYVKGKANALAKAAALNTNPGISVEVVKAPTKKEMLAHVRREVVKPHGGGARYEFHVYKDMADKKRAAAAGDYSSLNGDFSPWADLPEWLVPGRVIDVFVYDRGSLDHNVVIELPH